MTPARTSVEVDVEGRTLSLSNLDKVLWPRVGLTKGWLIDYYTHVAPVILPHIRGHPMTLHRFPDGVDGMHWFETRAPAHPPWVQTMTFEMARSGKVFDVCVVNDLPSLVWAANMAALELHLPQWTVDDKDERRTPDLLVFDLDPGPPATIVECSRVALWLHGMFENLGIESFAKTSGSKGMQVYVPLNTPGVTYDGGTKDFARAVAELLEREEPDLVVSRMTKALRPGKVLVDWSQNDEHKTTVNVYSLRAKDRPTVSTPITWDEVAECDKAGDPDLLVFDSEQVLARVEEHGDLFAPVASLKQELPKL